MVTIAIPTDVHWALPFLIGADTRATGARLGGRAPEGIGSGLPPSARYFATVPLTEHPRLEGSLFLAERNEHDLILSAGQLFRGEDLGPIVIRTHEASERGDSRLYESDLPPRTIVLQPLQDDWYVTADGERVPLGRHKIGGRAAIFKEWDLEPVLSELTAEGFRQVLQFDFPGPDDEPMTGTWPFGDGMFHVFGKYPFGPNDWASFWEI